MWIVNRDRTVPHFYPNLAKFTPKRAHTTFIFTTWRYASALLAMAASVCHKSEYCQNKLRWFWKLSLTYATLSYKGFGISTKIGTFTLELCPKLVDGRGCWPHQRRSTVAAGRTQVYYMSINRYAVTPLLQYAVDWSHNLVVLQLYSSWHFDRLTVPHSREAGLLVQKFWYAVETLNPDNTHTHTWSAPSNTTDCVTDGYADGRRVLSVISRSCRICRTRAQTPV